MLKYSSENETKLPHAQTGSPRNPNSLQRGRLVI